MAHHPRLHRPRKKGAPRELLRLEAETAPPAVYWPRPVEFVTGCYSADLWARGSAVGGIRHIRDLTH